MEGVEPLLRQLDVQQDHCVAYEVDYLFVVLFQFLLVDASLPYRCRVLFTHSILECPLDVLASDAVNPLQLHLDLIGSLQIVVYRNLLFPVRRDRLQGRVQPCSEVVRPLVEDEESRRLLHEVQPRHAQLRAFQGGASIFSLLLLLRERLARRKVRRLHPKPLEVC